VWKWGGQLIWEGGAFRCQFGLVLIGNKVNGFRGNGNAPTADRGKKQISKGRWPGREKRTRAKSGGGRRRHEMEIGMKHERGSGQSTNCKKKKGAISQGGTF